MNKETKPDAPELPPLPDFQPVWRNIMTVDGTKRVAVYNALVDMLHAYARAVLAARPPEPLTTKMREFLGKIAQADALDARRYRWFRAQVQGVRQLGSAPAYFGYPRAIDLPALADIMRGSVAEHFDAAIDAAMLSSAPTGAGDV